MITRDLDPRARKLARIVVNYSVDIEEGDLVRIEGEPVAMAFMEQVAMEVINRGGKVDIGLASPVVTRHLLEQGSPLQICAIEGYQWAMMHEMDARIRVFAHEDPLSLKGVNGEKVAAITARNRRLLDVQVGDGKGNPGKKWCVVGFPTEGDAREAGMSLDEYADLLYGAANIDWKKASKRMGKIKEIFDAGQNVRVHVPGQTDLQFSLGGRGGQICDGKKNMPDGEVFYGPVEDSAEGHIYFPLAIKDGNRVVGIRLEYQNGRLVRAEARQGQSFLEEQLAIEGADWVGEFGIGANPGIQEVTGITLYDEKIDGTIHFTPGSSYPFPLSNGGGKNQSDQHWDLICELRRVNGQPGGEIYVDDKLVQKNGVWRFER